MKKITVLLTWVLCGLQLNAQTDIEKEVSKITRLIERNVTTDGRKPSRLQEYYMYDINLDSSGRITHIDLLQLDSSFYANDIKKIIPLIEKNWTPVKSPIIKVIIPVLITDNNRLDKETEYNMSVAGIAAFFEEFLKGNKAPQVFVAKMSIVEAISSQKRDKAIY